MGEIRFDAFMEHALYHPEEGYYAKRIQQVGKGGDFSTSATLSTLLAKKISQWIVSEIQDLQLSPIHILEIGAGTGQLMSDIYKALPFLLKKKCHFHIVEKSSPLKDIQQKKLKRKKVQWHTSVAACLKITKGEALIYSNELVDAFPVRIFRKTQQDYEELYIDTAQRCEIYKPIDKIKRPISSFFEHAKKNHVRFEIHESYHYWLAEWASLLKTGSVLTIDYGDTVQHLLAQHPRGSLRGYFQHQKIIGDNLYHNVGHQDLTTDVNFTDLEKWGQDYHWKTITLSSQSTFLEATAVGQVDQFLVNPDGAGTAFKVLHQRSNAR